MATKTGEPQDYPVGTSEHTDTLLRQGRSVFAARDMITSGFEDMSNLTAELIPLPTVGVEMEIVSTSADDNIAGSAVVVVKNCRFTDADIDCIKFGADASNDKPPVSSMGELSPRLKEIAPDMKLVFLAYTNTLWPPEQLELDLSNDNLIYMVLILIRAGCLCKRYDKNHLIIEG